MSKRKSHKKKYIKKASFFHFRWIVFGCIILGIFIFGYNLLGKSAVCGNSITCAKGLTGNYQYGNTNIFMGNNVNSPIFIADNIASLRVLGETNETKHIYVDLQKQRLQAFEGNKKVMEFPISSGKWARTPTGEFKIWIKLRYTRMSGGNPDDNTYYDLSNVPYTMFFSGSSASADRGFALHGAYWHNNFGFPMSHGCVNIRPEDAKKLFYWAGPVSDGDTTNASDTNPGTAITIFGQPPV